MGNHRGDQGEGLIMLLEGKTAVYGGSGMTATVANATGGA